MTQAVAKVAAEAGLGDHVAGHAIDIRGRHPRADCGDCLGLGSQHNSIMRLSLGEILPVTRTRVKSLL